MTVISTPQVLRRALAAAATVTLSIALTGCGAGFDAQTLKPYQAAEGTNAQSGLISVRNLMVLADAEGKGRVYAGIVNDGDTTDTLEGFAQAPEPEQGTTTAEEANFSFGNVRPFTLEPGTLVKLPPASGDPVTITGAKPGEMIYLTVTFGKAAPINAYVPVLPDNHFSPAPEGEAEAQG